jgi:UDP-N-acetylmuramyl pentapeptide phosphotransferase/UDP-N-acetylglucosamine-1-phosphate transferase
MLGLLLLSATTNAVNFMDGINGITALHALVWGVLFSVVLRSGSSIELVALALALAGAATAFLPWNLVAARAFLGDSGSYLVGGVVGLLSLNALIVAGPVVALCPLAIYAADTGSTLLRRLMRRAPLAQAHHEHTYQRLVDLGWSHLQTAALVVAATAVCSALALLARGGPPPLQAACAALTVGLCVGYLAIPSVVQIRRGRADEFRP